MLFLTVTTVAFSTKVITVAATILAVVMCIIAWATYEKPVSKNKDH